MQNRIIKVTKRYRCDIKYCLTEIIVVNENGQWENDKVERGTNEADRWIQGVSTPNGINFTIRMWDHLVQYVHGVPQYISLEGHDILIETVL